MAGSVHLFSAATAVVLLAIVTGGNAQCYSESTSCSGTNTPLTTAQECCVGDGESYNAGSGCQICYVLGYTDESREQTLDEGGQSDLVIEVLKPPSGTGASFGVQFQIQNGANTADVRVGGADNPPGQAFFGPFGRRDEFTIRAEADQVGQEGVEMFTIPLSITSTNLPVTVFVGSPAQITVNDRSNVQVELTEADYQEREGRGGNVIVARVLFNRDIANPITITFHPVTYTEYASRGLTLPPGFPSRESGAEFEARDSDFVGDPITVTLVMPAQGTNRQVELNIPFTDDAINEHQETLVGYIEIASAVDTGTITLGRTATQLIIDDNDGITIGFTDDTYTFTEGQTGAFVTLAKDSGIVSERNDIAVRISLQTGSTATQGSDFSVVNLDARIDFEPSAQSINIPLSIIEDSLPEGVESFTLSVASADFGFGVVRVDTFETTEIFIADDDNVVVGLERTIYTVAESAGSVEVCAVVTNPPSNQPLPTSFTLVANTLAATATGGSDYTDFNSVLPEFNSANRRRCFTITILEDIALEDDEQFRALIALSSGTGVTVEPSEATVVITDIDPLTIGLVQTEYTVNEGDPLVLVCAEVKSGVVGRETAVSLATQDGTALAASDYSEAIQILVFQAGNTQMCTSFLIINDEVLENSENFNALLTTRADRVTIAPGQGTITIIDNDSVRVGFQELTYTASESGGSVEVCAVVDQGEVGGDVVVNIQTSDGSALAGSDYTALPSTAALTFVAPSTRACTNIDITNDQLFEIDEDFTATLTSPDTTRVTINAARDVTTVQITDDDNLVIGFDLTTRTVNEGDPANLCASVVSGTIGREVPIGFRTEDSTARRTSDYTFLERQLDFRPGTDQVCVDVVTQEDDVFEETERFFAQLSGNLPRLTVEPARATVTILDDDDIRATIGFREPSYTVVEGEGSVTVEVELRSGTIPAGNEVVVSFSTANQVATAPNDYTATQRALTFTSATTRIPITIPITDDSDIEDVERFLANLVIDSTAFPEVNVNPAQATIDIVSNDLRIGFVQTALTVSEADSGVGLEVRVLEGVLSPQLGNVPVTVSTNDVSASDGSDYAGFTQTFTFNSGNTGFSFSVPILDDSVIEPTEQLAVTARTSTPGVVVNPSRALVDITDNDVVIGFSRTEYTVDEDAGTVELFVSVQDGAIPAGETRTVTLTTSDGTAQAPSDYTSVFSRPLTFSSTQPTDSVTINIIDNTIVETNLEQFTARLSVNNALNPGVTLAPSTASVTIDDDDVVIGFAESSTTVSESGNAVLFVVIVDGTIPPGEQYIVTLTTRDGTADGGSDYQRTTRTLTFSSTTTSIPVNIPIIDDDDVEGNENFQSSLTVDSDLFPVTLAPGTADIEILDNDVVIGLERTVYTVDEGNAVSLVARVLEGVITQNTVVTLSTQDGTATSPDDFTAISNERLTFAPRSVSRSVILETVEDNSAEGTEQLTAILTVNSNVYPGVTIRNSPATVNIQDDDSVTVVLNSNEYRVVESRGPQEVCVQVQPSDALQRPLEVTLSTRALTATAGTDFTAREFTLNFDQGINQLCRDIPIIDDDVTERAEETFEVIITSSDPQVNVGPPNRANVIIEDDDPAVIGFEATQYTVGENQGSASLVVAVLDGELSDDVTVVFTTEEGTATSTFPTDYSATTRTLEFGPGRMSQTVAVPVINDQVLEDTENFFGNLELRNANNLDVTINPPRSEVSITDFGDNVEIGLERTSYTTEEDGVTVEVCARVTRGTLEREVLVDLATSDDSAVSTGSNVDYTSRSVTLTFGSSTSLQCSNIPVTDDDILEEDERFTVSLTTDDSDVTLRPDNGQVIILNNDDVTVGFEFPTYSVDEDGGLAEICAVVTEGGFQNPIRLTINSRDASASSQAPRDFTAVVNRVLTFQPGSTKECFNLDVTDDQIDEPPQEDLFLTITTTDTGVSLNPDTTRVIILDDDEVVIGFERTAVTVLEGAPSVELCAAILEGTLGRNVDVTLSTQPGTATAGVDYGSVNNVILRFGAATTRQCTSITIREDNVVEPDSETFTATLTDSPSEGIILQPDEATVTILDETNSRFGFERTAYTGLEGTVVSVCVVLLSPISLARQVTPRVSSQDINATANSDYRAVDIPLLFEPGDTRECFNVTLLTDDVLEGTEQLTLSLVQTEERMSFQPLTTIVNILDEGQVVIGLEVPSYTVTEGEPNVEVCARVIEGSLDRDVPVALSTRPRSATGGGVDYNTVTANLVFNSGTTRACTRIPIIDDTLDEDSELFDIVLSTTDSAISLAPAEGMVTIIDNDVVTIGLTPTSATVSEDVGSVEFCAQVTGSVSLQRPVQVTLSSQPGSATASLDYGSVAETLLFDRSTDSQCVSISILQDDILESNETFSVTLESTDEVNLSPAQGTVTIIDTTMITPEFEIPNYSVPEDDGPEQVCVIVPPGQIDRDVIVQLLTRPGTATSDVDYDAGPYQVTFTVGSTRRCTEIGIIDDNTPEEDETIIVTIPPSPDVTPPDTPTTITILDDDVIIGFDRTAYQVGGDDRQVVLTVSVQEGDVLGNVVVRLTTRDDTATSPADYTAVSTQLTFTPTRTSINVPITIAPAVLNEQMESFLADLTLVSPGGNNVQLIPDEAEIQITPVGAARIGFERTQYMVNEENGSVTVVVRVLEGELAGDVEVNFTTSDGTATSSAPIDYTGTTTTLTFGPSDTSREVSIPITDDSVVESVENFFADLSLSTTGANVIIGPPRTEIMIKDDDAATPEFEIPNYSVPEDEGPEEVCVVVPPGQIDRDVIVQLLTQGGTATSDVDYDAGPYQVTFTVGSTRRCADIGIIDDNTPEEDETIIVTIPPSPDVTPPDTPTTITILDDDVIIGFDRTAYQVGGDDGQVVLTVSVQEGNVLGNVVVRLTTRDDTATAPADYTAVSTQLTFTPTRTSINVPITIAQAILNEQLESFLADLTLVSPGGNNVQLIPNETLIQITPVGAARIGFERTQYMVNEDNVSVTVVVRVLEGELAGDVEVNFTTSDGTATSSAPIDYTGTTTTLTFGSNATSREVSIPITDDSVVESVENFFADLSLGTTRANVIIGPSRTEIMINDDDAATPEFEIPDYSVPEDEGPEEVCVVVPPGQIERDVIVQLLTQGGTATSDVDYDAGPYQVTFTVGSTRRCADIGIIDDNTPEEDETIIVTIPPSPDVTPPDTPTTITILDDDVIIGFDRTAYQVGGDDGQVVLTVSVQEGDVLGNVVVRLTTRDDTATSPADYTAVSTQLTFTPTRTSINVPITIAPAVLNEQMESFLANLTLVSPGENNVQLIPDEAEIQITPVGAARIGFERTQYTVNEENGSVTVVVRVLEGELAGDVEVNFTTSDGTATSSAPIDYTGTTTTLTFGPSDTSREVSILITDDSVVELVENFFADLSLRTTGANVIIGPPQTEIMINDDDVFTPEFEFPEYTIPENEGPATVCILVPAGQLERQVVVTFRTMDLIARASQDYTPQDFELTFEPGSTRECRIVPIIDDSVPENNEPFTIRVTVPQGPPIQTTVTIIDDDEECPQLPNIPFGSVSQTGRQVGDTATYSCDTGFELVGPPTRTCSQVNPDTAAFDGREPICRPQCQDLRDIPFGSVSQTGISVGDTATYSCNPGFELVGPPTRTCTEINAGSAEFDGREPVCRPQCQDLRDIPFGSVSQTGLSVGDTATYSCNPGFELVGPPTRVCRQVNPGSADFDGQEPRCIPECPQLLDIPFGSVSQTGRQVGDTATYSCNSGFELVGPPTRTCSQVNPGSAEFDGQEPVCRPLCRQLTTIPFGSVSRTGLSVGDTATYSCNPGFELVGPPTRVCRQVNPGSAEFDGQNPVCRPQCEDLADPVFGSVTVSGISVGDTATYTCDPGFNLIGTMVRVCEQVRPDRADWSSEPPVCEPDCPILRTIPFGSVSQTGRTPGDTATYSCNTGFELVGPSIRTCRQLNSTTTDFGGQEPFCRPLCEDLPNPTSGTVVLSGNSVGDTATYSCNPGFNLVGSMTRTCVRLAPNRADWSSEPPVCERITVRFARPSYTFTESDGMGSITVIKTGISSSPFTVRVSGGPSNQRNIERSAPAIDQLITFEAGPSAPNTINVTFPLTDDDVALEDVERFLVDLSVETPGSGVTVVQPERTQINVLDDDVVRVEFGRPEASFNESEGLYRMCIVKDRVTAQRVTVEISDTPATAGRNEDYRSVPLRLISIEPDDTRTCFQGIIIDDLIGGEGVEFFTLNILPPTQPGVTVRLDETTINIVDDDVVTVVMVRPVEPVRESSGEARVCARKDIATAGAVEAAITTSPGKAGDGADYVGGTYTVSFGPEANAVACATITIVVDNIFEDIENFDTNLSPGGTGNVVVGPEDNTVVLIDDLGDDVVNDTLIGDPLLTVPLPDSSLVAVPGVREASLCYEVHGREDAWYNLLSDGCVSVNAHYFRFDNNFNFVDKIAIRTVDERGNCKNILVELNGCTTTIDGSVVQATTPYCQDGVFVRPSRQANRVRISVPNCNETSNLVMWTICQRNTLMDPFDMMRSYTVNMIKFVIARGLTLGASSHGIIGQFWNIPISLGPFTGVAADAANGQRYIIQVNHPDSDPRVFTGLLAGYSWEQDRSNCFYVGNRQAGTIMEVQDPNDPVIEGTYSDYETGSDFSTTFRFTHFDESRCS